VRSLSGQFDNVRPDRFRATYETPHGSARVTPTGYVHNVFIRPEHRGVGHGTALMNQIVSDADRLGLPLSLNAREDLHLWYQRMGFNVDTSPAAEKLAATLRMPLLVRQPRR